MRPPSPSRILMRFFVSGWLLLSAAAGRAGDGTALVGLSDLWRYMGFSPTATVPTNWISPGFDDSSWFVGASGFGTTTYGEATRLPATNGWERILLRTRFVLDTPPTGGRLSLRADYGGGFVVWLNGVEVARRGLPGLPGSLPDPAQDAAPRPAGAAELLDLGPAVPLLQPGTNHLAVQIHSDGVYSEWPVFTAELLSGFTRAPYLQNVSSNRAEVLFSTPPGTSARVVYGASGEPERSATSPAGTRHRVRLEGLRPGAEHLYRVELASADGTTTNRPVRFRALPMSGPLSVQVIGDSGGADIWQHRVTDRMAADRADLLLHAGDIIYPGFMDGLADIRFLSVQREVMAQTPGFFAWGNHDLYWGTAPFLDVLKSPTNDTPAANHVLERTLPESYYSFDAGDVHFVVLFQPFVTQYLMRPEGSQAQWLDRDLASTAKPWKVVLSHLPAETSGLHRFDDFNFNGVRDSAEFAAALMPIARRRGVQLLLAGHDHDYERLIPADGITAVVTGGGGGPPYGLRETDPRSATFLVAYHHTRLDFDGDRLRIRCIDWQGRVLDDATVTRTPPPQEVREARFGTVRVEPTGAPDGDGNFVGQSYDLTNAPAIPSFTGRWSTLGNLRVQVDAARLHLGLDGLGLTPGSDAYLFLEVPGLEGVDRLEGLGNRIVDPLGQGADALDFASSVSFEDFRPAIAAVVGDEYADRTDRAFRRPGSTNALGQGVFRLTPGFPDVPEARMQQFNRAVQDGTVAPQESSAGFVEISVPLAALGNLSPGQEIRVGLLAGLDWNGPGGVRPFDTGYLGDALRPGKDGRLVLTGTRVRLPEDPDPDADGLESPAELAAGTDPRNADTDGDGLRDGWEVSQGTDPRSGDGADGGAGDPDGDGFTNLEEQRLGTPPRDGTLPLRLSASRSRGTDGRLRLEWRAALGRRYQLEAATRLGEPFTVLGGFPRAAAAEVESAEVPDTESVRFLRLRRLD